jgi:hypothetical protein
MPVKASWKTWSITLCATATCGVRELPKKLSAHKEIAELPKWIY